MHVAVITALTGPESVEIRDVADPVPRPGRVLVDVEYAGVAFPDVLQTRGGYQLRPELPFSPGWEVVGIVREDDGGSSTGDRVAAMPVIGGFAETVAMDEEMVFPLPDDVPFDEAAGLPLNHLTMHFTLQRRARLVAGETVLGHGAAGGIGIATCQLAAANGARVLAVVSTPRRVRSPGPPAPTRSSSSTVSATRSSASPMDAVWTSSSTRSAATASPIPCVPWPGRVGWWSSASPAGRSPRSGSTGCC